MRLGMIARRLPIWKKSWTPPSPYESPANPEYLDFLLANLMNATVSYSPWHKITGHRLYPLTTNSRLNRSESCVTMITARRPCYRCMRPAPAAAIHTAIPAAIGAASQEDSSPSNDRRTIPRKTSSSRNPPRTQATTMPAKSVLRDSLSIRNAPRVGGFATHRVATLSANGL